MKAVCSSETLLNTSNTTRRINEDQNLIFHLSENLNYNHIEGAEILSIATRLWVRRSGFDSRQRQGVSLFVPTSRPALMPTQPPIQWVPGALTPEVKRPGRIADTHLHLAPMLRTRGAIPSFPHTSSRSGA